MTDVPTAIREAIKSFGGSDSQADDAAVVLANQVGTVQGIVCLIPTGAALDHETSKAWLAANKPHLLPRAYQANDADLAFIGIGNKTAAARLIREVGKERADEIAQTYGKAHALDNRPGVAPQGEQREQQKGNGTPDHKNNPFSRAGWNISKQGALVRSLGIEKASAMARAVGVTIGATRPAM